MKILVTGATGFVGRALLARLAIRKDIDLSIAARSETNQFSNFANVIYVNSLDAFSDWSTGISGVDVILHLAARVHVMRDTSVDPMVEYRKVNVEGTLNLARQAADAGVRRFVFLSTIKVNGESTKIGHPFEAGNLPAPQDPYGISKMEAEHGLIEISSQTGMEVVIIRPPLVYGPGVKANFASMMKWLCLGVPLPLGGITHNARSLVYVENLVDLILVCIEHPNAANQTFLVSDNEDVSTAMLLQRMAKALGRPACLVRVSPTIVKLIAKLIGKFGAADRLCSSLQVDVAKTRELLDWTPRFSLDEGLLSTAISMTTNRNK